MGLSDMLKGKQYKTQVEELERQLAEARSLLTPEMQDAYMIQQRIDALKNVQSEEENNLQQLRRQVEQLQAQTISLDSTIQDKKAQIIWMDDEISVQDFGLYQPRYEFASSLDYKERLASVRADQKAMIRNKNAVTGNINWTVNGSLNQGQKMVADFQKLLLRAFNTECDDIVSKVKYTNFDASLSRIHKSAEAISKLGKSMGIAIAANYLGAKVHELRLAFEYQQKKEAEKEEQRMARAEMREAAKLQKEIEAERKVIEKEQNHYQTALGKIRAQLSADPDNPNLLSKKAELEKRLADIDTAMKKLDYREANQKAGYVYVISNIGSFGKNVYKIGMTRRLDPQDRIDELGDASVPFNFDVHAMIFSDNAPALEAALHRAFEDRKLNMVNHRREFFHVTLDEIKEVVRNNYDKTVTFVDTPDAEQYRISEKMRGADKL